MIAAARRFMFRFKCVNLAFPKDLFLIKAETSDRITVPLEELEHNIDLGERKLRAQIEIHHDTVRLQSRFFTP